jgi:signal transduction histidine kinase
VISTIIKNVKIDLDVKLNKDKEIFGENNNDIIFKKHKNIINIFLFPNEEHDNIYHPLYVMVDRTRIIQVISNIINNPIKSIDNNDGNITITISRRDRGKNNFSKKNEMMVNIKDTGRGINPKIHSKLFEKFTTHSSSGIGLGLYISKSIIEAHGGTIWAENNNDGKGATFSFILPSV